jgi:hypothetical protein
VNCPAQRQVCAGLLAMTKGEVEEQEEEENDDD